MHPRPRRRVARSTSCPPASISPHFAAATARRCAESSAFRTARSWSVTSAGWRRKRISSSWPTPWRGFCARRPDAHFLVVGAGPSEEAIRRVLRAATRRPIGCTCPAAEAGRSWSTPTTRWMCSPSRRKAKRKAWCWPRPWPPACRSSPIDAAGVREVVDDRRNGRLLASAKPRARSLALWLGRRSVRQRCANSSRKPPRKTAEQFSTARLRRKGARRLRSKPSPPSGGRETRTRERWNRSLA